MIVGKQEGVDETMFSILCFADVRCINRLPNTYNLIQYKSEHRHRSRSNDESDVGNGLCT